MAINKNRMDRLMIDHLLEDMNITTFFTLVTVISFAFIKMKSPFIKSTHHSGSWLHELLPRDKTGTEVIKSEQ